MNLPDPDTLDRTFAVLTQVRGDAAADPEYGFDVEWQRFIRTMRLLHPQSYGARIQRWLQRYYGWTAVPASLDRGDCTDPSGAYREIKVSLITGSNTTANFVQIRPHQQLDVHSLFVVDLAGQLHRFDLDERQIAAEDALIGGSAHGTKGAVEGNVRTERALRFSWDDVTVRDRWRAYRVLDVPSASSMLTSDQTGSPSEETTT